MEKVSPPPDRYNPTPADYEPSKRKLSLDSELGGGSNSGKTKPEPQPAEPVEEPQPNNNVAEGPCQTYADCIDGPWRIVVRVDVSSGPTNLNLDAILGSGSGPSQLAEVLEGILGNLINEGQLNLMLNLDQPSPWLIQGVQTGSFGGLQNTAK